MSKEKLFQELHQSPAQGGVLSSGNLRVLPVCIRGKSHEALNLPLQDACAARALPNGWVVAAVADGVGSEPRADEGAFIAAHAVVDFCAAFFGYSLDDNSLIDLLKAAFQHAAGEISRRASEESVDVREFSTTLHAAIYNGRAVYYGHSGDGGLLVLYHNGKYATLTQPQKGDDGEAVIPLLAGPKHWQFGRSQEPVFSALLCTDGVYDKICSKILQKYSGGIETTLAGFFLSPYSFDDTKTSEQDVVEAMRKAFRGAMPNDFYPHIVKMIAQGGDEDAAQQLVLDHIVQHNRPLRMLQEIRDDISAVVMTQKGAAPETVPIEEYKPPDWDKINAQIYAALYPKSIEETNIDAQNTSVTSDEQETTTPSKKEEP